MKRKYRGTGWKAVSHGSGGSIHRHDPGGAVVDNRPGEVQPGASLRYRSLQLASTVTAAIKAARLPDGPLKTPSIRLSSLCCKAASNPDIIIAHESSSVAGARQLIETLVQHGVAIDKVPTYLLNQMARLQPRCRRCSKWALRIFCRPVTT